MLRALLRGNVAELREVLASGDADPNEVFRSSMYRSLELPSDECMPLHIAAGHIIPDVVTACIGALVSAGANVHAEDKDGDTPLHHAVRNQLAEAAVASITALVAAGAHLDAANRVPHMGGIRAIHSAAANTNPASAAAAIETLAKLGADIQAAREGGRTPLHEAAKIGSAVAVRALIAAGADVNTTSDSGETSLHCAAFSNAPWPLGRSAECIQDLVEAGAPVNAADSNGVTPLHCAAEKGDFEVLRALVAAGADVNVATNWDKTPLYLAAMSNYPWPLGRSTMCIQALVEAGVLVNAADSNGWTALHAAARHGIVEVVQTLVAAGADVNIATHSGSTPLHLVAICRSSGMEECVQALVAAGSQLDAVDEHGMTALCCTADHVCRIRVERSIVAFLVVGADHAFQGSYSKTILHRCADRPDFAGVATLVAAGADVHAQDEGGRIPLDYAMSVVATDDDIAFTPAVDLLIAMDPLVALVSIARRPIRTQQKMFPAYIASHGARFMTNVPPWALVPTPCPGLGHLLPRVAPHVASHIVRRMPSDVVASLRASLICLSMKLSAPLVFRIVCLSVSHV